MGRQKPAAEPAEDKEYRVPFRLVMEGDLVVSAASPEAAEAIADEGNWDDPDFFSTAEIVDWTVKGRAREVR